METTIQKFRARWAALWHGGDAVDCHLLLERYGELQRHYHNAAHIVACLEQLDAVPGFVAAERQRLLVQLAIFFHDAVYDPRGKDNELQSALLAERSLKNVLSAGELVDVHRLIMATEHKHPLTVDDETLMVDIDLSILGQPQAVFDAYEKAIRAEYAFVPDEQFRTGRAAVLRTFLQRPAIFTTPFFHRQYEATARVNLLRSMAVLTSV